MNTIKPATSADTKRLYKLDKEFYGDAFFNLADYKRMVKGDSINKVVVYGKDAFLIYCQMPKSKSYYINTLIGNKADKRKLLEWLLEKPSKRVYTHGKMKWGMGLLLEYGFKKLGLGDPKEEEVEFDDAIKKLRKFELIKK